MSVEFRHLRALVAIGEHGTITDAAADLGVTQPTLSRTLARFEELVDAELVERTTRALRLTEAGSRLRDDAVELLARLDHALTRVHPTDVGPLRLGWAWAGLGRHTVPLLRAWRERSDVPVEISRPDDPEIGLLDGSLDAAVVRRVLPEEFAAADTTTAHLFTESLVAAVAADGPLADRSAVSLAELRTQDVALCATSPTATLDLWDQDPPRAVTVTNTDEWLTLIALGRAVGVTAAATTYGHTHPGVAYLPLADAVRVEVSLAWPTHREHPVVPEFAGFVRGHFRDLVEHASPPVVLSL